MSARQNKVVFINAYADDGIEMFSTVAIGGGKWDIKHRSLPPQSTTERIVAEITDMIGFVEGLTVITDSQMLAYVLGKDSTIGGAIMVDYNPLHVLDAKDVCWGVLDKLIGMI
jgi:hypothetical protein